MPVAQGGLRDKKYRRALDTQSPRPNQLLAGQDRIYGANGEAPRYEWPVPGGRAFPIANRGYTSQATVLTLIGQDAIYGAAGQAADYEWTVPRGRQFPSDLRSFVQDTQLQLIGQDSIYAAPGESPVYIWVVPPGAQPHRENRTFLHRVDLQLLGQDAIYGAAGQAPVYDYPVPKGRPFPIGNRGWLHLTDQQLIGQDAIYGAPGQVPVYDTSLPPRGRPVPVDNRTWLQSIVDKFLIIVEQPFNVFDWPVPWGKAPHRENRTHLTNTTRMIGQDIIPGGGAPGQVPTYDLSLPPRGRPQPIANRTWLQSTVDKFFILVTLPFNQLSWPVPWGRPPHKENRTWLHTDVRYIGQDVIPGGGAPGQVHAFDWQLPTPARRASTSIRTWLQNLVGWFLPAIPPSPGEGTGTLHDVSIYGTLHDGATTGTLHDSLTTGTLHDTDIHGTLREG